MSTLKKVLIFSYDLFLFIIAIFLFTGHIYLYSTALSLLFWLFSGLSLALEALYIVLVVLKNPLAKKVSYAFAGLAFAATGIGLPHAIVNGGDIEGVLIPLDGTNMLVAVILLVETFFLSDKPKEEGKVETKGVGELDMSKEVLEYVEYREGAVELQKDRIVIYQNLIPFFRTWKKGRIRTVYMLTDLEAFAYKGYGWFTGIFYLKFKGFIKPINYHFSRWLPWHGFKVNPQFENITRYIEAKLAENYKQN